MNKTEAAKLERILRIAHRVAKRAVMDARTYDIGAGRGKVTTEIGQGLSEVQAIAFLRRYAGLQTGQAVDAIKKVTNAKIRATNKEGVTMTFGVQDYSGFKVHCFEARIAGEYRYTIKVWKPLRP